MPDCRRLRVLQILEATEGGTARHLLDLARHLPRDRFAVDVLCSPGRDPRFASQLDSVRSPGTRVKWVRIARGPSLQSDWAAAAEIARWLRGQSYDLVHTHSSKAGAVGRLAALAACPGAKRVHTPHAFPFLVPGGALRRASYRMAEKVLSLTTDRFIAVSQGEARRAAALGGRAQVSVVYNGVDLGQFAGCRASRAATRAVLGIRPADFVIGCVGRLAPQKGQATLLRVLALLDPPSSVAPCGCPPRATTTPTRGRATRTSKGGMSPARLLLVGDGPDRAGLRALADRLCVGDRVVFAGQRQSIAPLYGAMDVYVLPSLYEGCPYSLLEAMACGLPCLATDVDGSREIVEEGVTGRLVPVADADALASALADAGRSPDRLREWGRAGERRVAAHFSLDKMIAGVVEAYEASMRSSAA